MKVYFSASRFYSEQYSGNYNKILGVLNDSDLSVLDNSKVKSLSGSFDVKDEDRVTLYRGMLKLMDKADICVFEGSHPSTLHVGHEITVALGKGKTVIVLYTKGHEPILFKGLQDAKIIWVEYDDENLEEKLLEAIEEAKQSSDVRFNFFVSPKILTYLDFVAKKRMIPRSVFLRDLIEKEMKKDKQFKGQ